MVQDPTTGFFRIGWIDFEILLRWSQRSANDCRVHHDETTLSVATSTRAAVSEQHSLLQANSPNAVDRLRRLSANAEKPV
jgi:putative peptide zinc metalloprotease protein